MCLPGTHDSCVCEQNKRKQGVKDLESAVPTQEALLGGIHVWRLHDHVEQLAAVRALGGACVSVLKGT